MDSLTLTIDCDDCVLVDTDACAGCVVTALIGPPSDGPITIDAAEHRAVGLLGRCGLVPPLRHRTRPAWT